MSVERDDEVWTIEELLTPEDLRIEGSIMRHCVGSYVRACRHLRSSIWSMRVRQGQSRKRVLTIEVKPNIKTIWQAKGKLNSEPSQEARQLLELWAGKEKLKICERSV